MIRQRVSLAVAGAVVATTGLTTGLMTSASAAPTIYDPTFTPAPFGTGTGDLSGAGSDTSEIVLDYLTKGHGEIPGFNAGRSTGRVASFAAGTDPATVVLKAGQAAITRPNGSGAGKGLLYGANNNPDLDFARSSSTLSTAEIGGNLQQAAFAVDGLKLAVSATGTNAPASISRAALVKIYDGTYKKWSDVPGYAGPAPTAAIVPLIPQSGSGTRSFFEAQLKAGNGGETVNVSSIKETQEHSDADIKGNPNAIAPFSTGRAKGSKTVTLLDAAGSFSAERALYNVVRQADRAGAKSALIASVFGSDGFFCSPAAKPLIEAAGFEQLATPANNGACGTFGTADVAELRTNAPAKQSTTVLSAVAQNGKSVKLTASVTAPGGLPGGKVVFSEGSTQVGQATVVSGSATVTLSGVALGSHTYTASFTPTTPAAYVASVSAAGTATVLKTSAISVAPLGKTYGTAASVPVSVTADGAPAAGSVTVNAGGVVSTVALAGGAASIAVPATVAAGSSAISVTYSGDAATFGTSAASTLSVAKAKSASTLKLSKKSIKASKKAKATVTVKITGSALKAGGKVTLKAGSKTVGKGTVRNGKATITLSKLKKGSYKVKATFAGNANVGTSTSKTVTLKVTK